MMNTRLKTFFLCSLVAKLDMEELQVLRAGRVKEEAAAIKAIWTISI